MLGALLWGVRGVFIGQLAAFTAGVLAGLLLARYPLLLRLEWQRIVRLLKVGVPLAALGFIGYNLIYVDQVMTLWLLDRRALGTYTLALYAGAMLYLLPLSVGVGVGPRLVQRYGESASLNAVREYVWRPVDALVILLPPVIMATWIVVPLLIDEFLHAYTAAIAPLRIYVVAVFFLSLNQGVSSTLLALNKHRYSVPVIAVCVVLNVVVDVLFVRYGGLGLAGIALGSLVTYFVYWMTYMSVVRWFFGQTPARSFALNVGSGWPGLVLVGFVLVAWATGTLGDARALLSGCIFLGIACVISMGVLRRRDPFTVLKKGVGASSAGDDAR